MNKEEDAMFDNAMSLLEGYKEINKLVREEFDKPVPKEKNEMYKFLGRTSALLEVQKVIESTLKEVQKK